MSAFMLARGRPLVELESVGYGRPGRACQCSCWPGAGPLSSWKSWGMWPQGGHVSFHASPGPGPCRVRMFSLLRLINTNGHFVAPPPRSWSWTAHAPWTLHGLRLPQGTLQEGGLHSLDFLRSPTDPPGGGGWTLDLSRSPTDPPSTLSSLQNHLYNKSVKKNVFVTFSAFGGSLLSWTL